MSNPVALQLPTDLTLRGFDLFSAILPWSSSLFANLGELHLSFRGRCASVEILEDMLGVFKASTHSLYRLVPKLKPGRVYR